MYTLCAHVCRRSSLVSISSFLSPFPSTFLQPAQLLCSVWSHDIMHFSPKEPCLLLAYPWWPGNWKYVPWSIVPSPPLLPPLSPYPLLSPSCEKEVLLCQGKSKLFSTASPPQENTTIFSQNSQVNIGMYFASIPPPCDKLVWFVACIHLGLW